MADPRTTWLPSTDGVSLALHDLGGDGPPILLSHATGFHGLVLAPLARAIGTHLHSFAPDYRAHGDSALPETSDRATALQWRGFGDDAGAVARAIGLHGGIGFGHSMGGNALLQAELDAPGTFAALVLFEPITFPTGWVPSDGPELAVGASRRRSTFPSRVAAYENYAAKPPLDVLTPEALHAYVDHGFADAADGSVVLKCRPEDEAHIFTTGTSQDMFDRLPAVGCPVLVLAGDPQWNPPGMLAPEIAARLPAGRFVRMAELTHLGPMQDPAAVATRIVDLATETGVIG